MMGTAKPTRVVGAALVDGRRVLVARRGPGMRLAGRWEFPGGKVEPGEDRRTALARELREELGIEVRVDEWLGRGESGTGQGRVQLDVYAVHAPTGVPHAREHGELRWVEAGALDALDWAEADVPLLPAVRARLGRRAEAHRLTHPVEILCADWSLRPARRAVAAARPGATGWQLALEPAPSGGWSLPALLGLAEARTRETRHPVLVGVDAVLGVPAAFARRLGVAGFFEALEALAASGGLLRHAPAPAQWSPQRPFFRVPPGTGGLSRFAAAAGGPGGLLRQIDRHTGAKPVFVLSGIPGTVGSGSRSLWAELTPRLAQRDRRFRVWPFEGDLDALAAGPGVVLAEVYPRAAYAPALEAALPSRPPRLAKGRAEARARAVERLVAASWRREQRVALGDLAAARASEDALDAVLAAAGLVRLVGECRPLCLDCVDPRVEGGILATGALPPPRG